MTWAGATAPMKSRELMDDFKGLNNLLEEIEESFHAKKMMERMDRILDADYHKANLNDVTAEARHLTPEEQKQLNFLLDRFRKRPRLGDILMKTGAISEEAPRRDTAYTEAPFTRWSLKASA